MAFVNNHAFGGGWPEHNAEAARLLLRRGAAVDPMRIPVGDRHLLWPNLTPRELLFGNGNLDYQRLPELSDAYKARFPLTDWAGNPPLSEVAMNYSLLHDAVQKDFPELVVGLLRSGVAPLTAVRTADTPLHIAAICDHRRIAEVLIDWGSDLEMSRYNSWDSCYDPDDEGRQTYPRHTALDLAIHQRNAEMAAFLVERGAVPPTHEGTSRHLDRLLQEAGASPADG